MAGSKHTSAQVTGLYAFEWGMIVYALLSLIYIFFIYTKLQDPAQLIIFRVQAVLMTLALWGIYRLIPCRLMMLARFALQLALLSQWYPDTFELNRWMPNLDHVLATWEQKLFGFQPALTFVQNWSSPWISEPLTMGYESYYPLMVIVPLFYFFWRKEQFLRACFITLTSFFLFYVIFVFFPAGGPQYYYPAAGMDQIAQGIFPNIGTYFQGDYEGLPIPGWKDGLMYKTLLIGHAAGERPTAAFPSSHVGVTTVLLWLAWATRNRKLFFSLLPFGVLMFFATFYIQAHYAIDAIAGIVAGTMMYFLLKGVYSLLKLK